jgi:nucleotide-binding universal stress UspA family protein
MQNCIISYTGEGQHYWPLIERSIELAKEQQARLIFYDADSASRLGASPLPTVWSGEGLAEQFDNRLDPEQLEKAGREELRDRVRHAREQGVDAWAWLPSKRGATELAEYANQQHATLLVVPSDLDQGGLSGWFKGQPSTEQVAVEADQPVVVVDLEPEQATTS